MDLSRVTATARRVTSRYRASIFDAAGWAALIAGVWILTSAGFGLLTLGAGLLVNAAKTGE